MKALAIATLSIAGCVAPTISLAPDEEAGRTLTLETWDPMLGLVWSQGHEKMLNRALEALARDEGVDVLCLRSPLADAEREALVAAARGVLPFVGWVKTDRSTPFDDPRDLTLVPRALPTTPPCRDAADLAIVQASVDCLAGCRGVDGKVDEACALANCASTKPPNDPRCALCLDSASNFGSLDAVLPTCRDVAAGEMAVDGRLGALLLSRFPLSDVRAHVFPSTMLRHGALVATVTLPTRRASVVCGYFDSLYGMPAPYAGVFGAPSGFDGAGHEQQLFELNLLRVVRELPADRTTLVLGGDVVQWTIDRSTRKIERGDWDFFATNLEPLVPLSDLCTFCAGNRLSRSLPAKFDVFESLAFASGPSPRVESVTIARDQASWSDDAGKPIPVAPLYSLRTKVVLP